MENQGMETGNPGFAGPAGFQGRQLGAVILAFTTLDAQSLPWVAAAAASCLDFPRLTKETVGWFCPLMALTQAAAVGTCTICLWLVFLFSVQQHHN